MFIAGGYEAVSGSKLETEYLNLTSLSWVAGPSLDSPGPTNKFSNPENFAQMLGPADMIGSLLISAGQIFKLEQLGLSTVHQWHWVEAGELTISWGWFRSCAIDEKFCF